ncbi:MAG: hypothetical protein KBD37_05245, partial [Burkholderiales bacterium]|nr:hypothetical protein [Burkholderiales bacterium]
YNQNVNQMEVEKYQSTINKIIKESNRNDHPENRRPSDQTKRRDFFGTPSTAEIENTDSPREILLQSTTTATVQNTTLSFDNLEDELKKVTDVQCARLYNNNLPQCNYEDHIKAVFELLDRHSSKDLIRSLRYGSCLLRTAIENLFNLDDMKDIYGGEVDKATIDTNRCRVVKQLLMKLLDNIQNNQRPLQPNDEYLYVIYVIAISDDQKAYDKAKDMDIQPNKDMLNTIKDRFKEDSDIPGLVDQIMSTINVSADALSGSQPWQGTTGHPKRELR